MILRQFLHGIRSASRSFPGSICALHGEGEFVKAMLRDVPRLAIDAAGIRVVAAGHGAAI